MTESTTMKPVWIREDTVLAAHQRQLAEHGGLRGVRDPGLLQSAMARPQHAFRYCPEIALTELAAAYGYGIAKNHPFIDGNKRTAYIVTRLFLLRNGYDITATQEEKYRAVMALAGGEWDEAAFAAWLLAVAHPRG